MTQPVERTALHDEVWHVVVLREGGRDVDVSSADAWFRLEVSGELTGRAGNGFSGRAEVVGDRLHRRESFSMGVGLSGFLQQVEDAVHRVLGSRPRWRVEDGRLTLALDDGTGLVLSSRQRRRGGRDRPAVLDGMPDGAVVLLGSGWVATEVVSAGPSPGTAVQRAVVLTHGGVHRLSAPIVGGGLTVGVTAVSRAEGWAVAAGERSVAGPAPEVVFLSVRTGLPGPAVQAVAVGERSWAAEAMTDAVDTVVARSDAVWVGGAVR